MAVVSRVATLRMDDAVVHTDATQLRWVATAAVQDTAAGGSVEVTIVRTLGVGVTPSNPDTLTLNYYTDSGALIKTVALNTTAASQTNTLFLTDTGFTGGAARCGTVEIAMRATLAGLGAYDVETDGTPNTPPTGFDSHLDRGWVRGTTTLIEAASNGAAIGTKTEPAEYDESLFVRTTSGAQSYVARALTVASSVGGLSASTNSVATVTRDASFTNVVDERFAAASTVVSWTVTVQNATLTGQPAWTYTTTTDDTITVDPRLTCTHHMQINDSVFGVAKNAGTSKSSNESGYLALRITAARGTGKNSMTVSRTLTPAASGVARTASGATAAADGQDGWTALMVWDAGHPTGTWNMVADVTAPADIDADTHLVGSTQAYTVTVGGVAVVTPPLVAGYYGNTSLARLERKRRKRELRDRAELEAALKKAFAMFEARPNEAAEAIIRPFRLEKEAPQAELVGSDWIDTKAMLARADQIEQLLKLYDDVLEDDEEAAAFMQVILSH